MSVTFLCTWQPLEGKPFDDKVITVEGEGRFHVCVRVEDHGTLRLSPSEACALATALTSEAHAQQRFDFDDLLGHVADVIEGK